MRDRVLLLEKTLPTLGAAQIVRKYCHGVGEPAKCKQSMHRSGHAVLSADGDFQLSIPGCVTEEPARECVCVNVIDR